MIRKMFGVGEQETEEHWVSISDVMAGLMVIFLFIAISYMVKVNEDIEQITQLKKMIEKPLGDYKNSKENLSKELSNVFEEKLQKDWRGYLSKNTLSIGFKKPFEKGSATVLLKFQKVLDDFFPRYIKILTDQKYKKYVEEIRIEGHTSSEWERESTLEDVYSKEDAAYLENMGLSQRRSRNVLQYVLGIGNHKISPQDKEGKKKDFDIITENKDWIKEKLRANGLSFSQPILDSNGNENKEESRRVEFRVVTTSEKLIEKIQELIEKFDGTEVAN